MKKLRSIVAAGFCFLVSGPGWAQKMPSLAEMRSLLPMLDSTIQSNPRDAKSLYMRGSIYRELGDHGKSISDCTLAIAVDPNFAEAYNCRFVSYMYMKNYASALKDASEVVRLKNDADAYCNRAAVHLASKAYTQAIQDYTKAIQLNKNSAQAYDGLGETAYRLGKYDKAIGYCNRALLLDPHMSEAVYFRGKSFEALGKKDQAQKDLANARAAGYQPDQPFIRRLDK